MSVLTFTKYADRYSRRLEVGLYFDGSLIVDWGDGETTIETEDYFEHTYSANGTYTVVITGEVTALNYLSTDIRSISIPNSVTSLGDSCLAGSSYLSSIVIPSSITDLGDNCFMYCSSLESVYFNSSIPPSCGTGAWIDVPTTCKFYVPVGSLSAYTSASNYPDPNDYTYIGYNGSYVVAFDGDDYYTCNGSSTVKVSVTNNSQPVTGDTVTLTGTGSTLTATTDSDGVATFNLSSISESKSLTATYGSAFDTAVLVFLDNTTLFGSLYCLGRRLVANLEAKGITGIDFTDGLTTLVDEIPNIEPSIGGIVLDTALTCSASSNSVFVGDTVTFTGKLSCSFDDETTSDDDMEGYIKTALIEIYDGNTLLGSTSTDNNGEYSYTYTTTTAGTMSIVASYDGTDYYEDCVSSAVSVVVNSVTPVVDSISLTADKSILSYDDRESATLSATVLDQYDDPMENVTVTFYNGSTSMGTATTNSSGVATKSYSSSGAGDVSFTAEVGSLVSEIFELEDCDYYNANTISTATLLNKSLLNTTACTIEFDLTKGGSGSGAYIEFGDDSNNYIGVGLIGSGAYGFIIQKNGSRVTNQNKSGLSNGTFSVEFTYDNGSITCVINNQTLSYTHTQAISKILNAQVWSSGSVQNIKVKAL